MTRVYHILLFGLLGLFTISCEWHRASQESIHSYDDETSTSVSLSELEEWVERKEEDHYAHYRLAQVLFDKEELKESEKTLRKALALDSGVTHYWWLMARIELANNNYSGVIENGLQAEALGMHSVELFRLLSEMYIKKGINERASHYINLLKSLDHTHQDIHLLTAHNYLIGKDTVDALNELSLANKLDPGNMEIGILMSELLLDLGEKERAVGAIKKGLAQDKNHAVLHKLAGKLLQQEGDKDSAAYHFTRALTTNPGDLESVEYMAKINIERRKFEIASKFVDKYEKLGGDSLQVFVFKGDLAFGRSRNYEAMKWYKKVPNEDGSNTYLKTQISRCVWRINNL